jgi:hypothetical protein
MGVLFKNKVLVCLWISFFAFITFFLFLERGTFTEKYDAPYWKDRFEHSRFQLPLSQRGIGDDMLYAYGGYTILHGTDPTKIVFDKPAFGLSIIGIFISVFNNPAYYGLFVGLGTILVFFLISKKVFNDTIYASITTILFSLNPLFLIQLTTSLLDVLQLFFLLLNIYFYLQVVSHKSYALLLIFLSSLFLGFSAQTKIPVFFPVILFLQIGYLVYKKYWKLILTYGMGIIVSVGIGYAIYFAYGYSFISYIRIQKYIIHIYQISKLPNHPEAIWQFLLTGFFPDVVSRKPIVIEEWSLILPFVTIIGFIGAVHFLLTKKSFLIYKGFSIILFINGVVLSFIPTYPRYLLFIFPFLYLITFLYMKNYFNAYVNKILISIVLICAYGQVVLYLHPSPSQQVTQFYHNFSQKYFQDMYQENIVTTSRPSMSRESFFKTLYSALQEGKIQALKIDEIENSISRFSDSGRVLVKVTYFTEYLGSFSEMKEIKLQKENNKWKIIWNWDDLLNGYKPDYTLKSVRISGQRGDINNKDTSRFAEDREGYLITFNPSKMAPKEEAVMLQKMTRLVNLDKLEIQNAYLENVPIGLSVPLFTTFVKISPTDVETLSSFKGVEIVPYPARIYQRLDDTYVIKNTRYTACCTKIYSSYNYHGDKKAKKYNPEYRYDAILSGYDGGSLYLVNEKNSVIKKIIEKSPKNGSDINYE